MKGYGVVLVFTFSWHPTFELKKQNYPSVLLTTCVLPRGLDCGASDRCGTGALFHGRTWGLEILLVQWKRGTWWCVWSSVRNWTGGHLRQKICHTIMVYILWISTLLVKDVIMILLQTAIPNNFLTATKYLLEANYKQNRLILINHEPTHIWLTEAGSKGANHDLLSTNSMTTLIAWLAINSIMYSVNNKQGAPSDKFRSISVRWRVVRLKFSGSI